MSLGKAEGKEGTRLDHASLRLKTYIPIIAGVLANEF